ncbi:UvrD-helicase domain-containing protein [Butyrivibrio sp. INlla14]|uniref:UvrD-helicase domain-containing protein n=1 Tax=Butyrivibrio sp. INlla14 TaxID=1520808 RepID=UPI00087747CA|nr:UvrD-helicase domain-containing protein [Butyrivibrio sp. INlla14]SCY51603.1 DNA helicase-2 / ATP-dependent DNA helicase PcrA [Butyrivibrio sp. INlla14]
MGIYDTLNMQQKKAVLQTDGPVLILAGAGSGKTRVLTHRVAYLIDECNVNPWNIMAITFTNKAAGEMRERVDKIVGFGAESIWVSTFHSSCVRILRRYADKLGYGNNFTIYDTDDSKTVMKDICKKYQLETTTLKLRQIMSSISKCKDNLVSPEEYALATQNDHIKVKISKAYTEYQAALKKNNAMDFDDLIVKTVELFKKNPDVLDSYQERFKYIMVDEYQDTNNAQFELIRLLADKYQNLCVVGDDDQSIYRFRGANIRNILDFEKVYKNATVIKLEQNYRSTQQILDAANAVIQNNFGRKDKALWTDEKDGDKVRLRQFDTAYDEAEFIASDIGKLKRNGKLSYDECAVLYRTNAQSRLIEERFVHEGIPYDIVGGTNFYARREIKDLLAYLKTIDNGSDDVAVKRIINVPKRGIGATTLDYVQNYADERRISFFEALCEADQIMAVSRSAGKLMDFVTMIRAFRTKMKTYSLEDLLKDVIDVVGYMDYLKTIDDEDDSGDNDRAQNVDELISKIASFEEKAEETGEEASLSSFLEEVALIADIDKIGEDNEKVLLMTLHSAKGLEFEHVYLAGMEEGVFPSHVSFDGGEEDPEDIEEERRLAYVGITRAKRHLTLSAARMRKVWGRNEYHQTSRFVYEIPDELLDKSGLRESNKPAFLFDDGDSIDEYEGVESTYSDDSAYSRGYNKRYNTYSDEIPDSDLGYSGIKPAYAKGIRKANETAAKGSGYGTSVDGAGSKSGYGGTGNGGSGAGARSGLANTYKLKASPVNKPPLKRAQPKDKPYISSVAKTHTKGSLAGLSKGMPTTMGKPEYSVGDKVSHIKYGVGVVTGLEEGPRDYKVTVEFDDCGQKIMYAAFAKLKKI